MFENARGDLDNVVTSGLSRSGLEFSAKELSSLESGVVARRLDAMAAIDAVNDGGMDSSTPMIVNAKGVPLWMGQETRTATPAQWRALIARDQGCVVCGADPSRCEAHYIVYWLHHGNTNLTNLTHSESVLIG